MADDDEKDGEENPYSKEARGDLVDDDEISAGEEGFMRGYDEASEEEEGSEEEGEEKEKKEEEKK